MNLFDYDLTEILILGLALLYSIISHELGHGYVAYLMGDNTAKNRGRLSLNPLRHIDPIGLFSMLVFKFGWAKPVPINVFNFKKRRLGIFLVSIAGIFVNILSAFIALLIIAVFPDFVLSHHYFLFFLSLIVTYGISLACFNLLPIPPLDGSKIVLSFLPKRIQNFFFRFERYGFFILMILLFLNVLDKPINILFDFIYTNLINLASIFA